MNVWIMQTGEQIPIKPNVRKLRTRLLADVLVERGHDVRWWLSSFEHQSKQFLLNDSEEVELHPRLRLHALKGCGYKSNISIKRYIDHRVVANKFIKAAGTMARPDVIVANMPDHHLAYEAVRYAKMNGIPSVVDVRDKWPEIFVEAIPGRTLQFLARCVLWQDFKRSKYIFQNSHGIVAVTNEFLNWGLEKSGRSKNHFDAVIMHGYQKLNEYSLPDGSTIPELLKKHNGRNIVLFVGSFGRSYELQIVLKAAEHFSKMGAESPTFVFAGDGEQRSAVEKNARKFSNVEYVGWIDASELAVLISKSYIGLVPCRSAVGVLANKVFEYMAYGVPVVSSLEGEIKDTIKDNELGLFYHAGDCSGLISCIDRLHYDARLRDRMARNAEMFFGVHGDAQRLYSDFCDIVEDVACLNV